MALMKKYDKYKDSGIQWIGEIPEHWEEVKMKYIGYLYGGLSGKSSQDFNQTNNELNHKYIPFTNVANNISIDVKKLQNVVIKLGEHQNQVKKNDLFFLMSSENYDDVGLSSVLLEDIENTYLNSFCKGFRLVDKSVNAKFLNYLLRADEIRHNLRIGANGFTRINLKIEKIKDLFIGLPPLSEQTAIADYLDRKTEAIDELIANKERLIELYQEEKTAIINQVVTKSINPNVAYKDSGIPWLGKIPKHWEMKKLNWCFDIIGSGTTPKSSIPEYYLNGTHNWLMTGDLNDAEITQTSKKITDKAMEDYSSLKVYPIDSIVMAMYGATIGKLGILKIRTAVNQACCVFSHPRSVCNYKYIFHVLINARKEIINMGYGGGQPNISQELLKQFKIQVPPITEQIQIVQYIEKEIQRIDNKISQAQQYIDLLKEYRTALISEVVTGKVKVID